LRRDFLRRGALLGLSGATIAALMAACGGAGRATTAPAASAPAATSARGPAVPGGGAIGMTTTTAAVRTVTTGDGAADGLLPILFVHGNGDSAALWITTVWRFESNGWSRDRLVAIDYPYPNARDDDAVPQPSRSSSTEQRGQLAARVDEVLARTSATKVALIGNSRGGNSIRNYLKNGGGAAKVSHAILCGTPNHGVYNTPGNNSEFNGAGAFLTQLNAGSEVVEGVAFLTIRSDKFDKFAQPKLASGRPSNVGYDSPELRGATNVVIEGIDHRETAYGPRAFAEMYRFLTSRPPATTDPVPEATVRLSGLVTGYENTVPTNLGVPGVVVSIFEVDPATGARRGGPLHQVTTGTDGSWGQFAARPDARYEFVVAAPGQPPRHVFRSPFPRSSPYVSLRLFEDAPPPGQGLVVFTRPRGYVATGRDRHELGGMPVPGVKEGVPTDAIFKVPFDPPERGVPASLNGESLTVRAVPGAVVYAEFHY